MGASTPDYDDVWRDVYGDMQDVGPVHRHMRRLVARILAGISYSTALEIGCGAGHNFDLLLHGRHPSRLTGADISTEALERARKRAPQAELSQLDIEREFLPGTWELVFTSLLLEHLPNDHAALRNIRSMTARHLLITTIGGDFERYRPWEVQMGHVRNYARGELEAKLDAAGFRVRRAIYWGWPLYSPLARRLQNRMTSEPSYNLGTRALAAMFHKVYYMNSSRRGDLLIVLADAAQPRPTSDATDAIESSSGTRGS